MADHIDKRLRDAATALLTGLATTGARTYKSRAYPMQDADLPGLRIYVDDSEIHDIAFGGGAATTRQERAIELKVEFCGKATVNYDDQADASKKEVEQAIAGNLTLGGVVKTAQMRRIETEREGEGEKVVIVTRMVFVCTGYTARNAPDISL